jgi:hypothetical protein
MGRRSGTHHGPRLGERPMVGFASSRQSPSRKRRRYVHFDARRIRLASAQQPATGQRMRRRMFFEHAVLS